MYPNQFQYGGYQQPYTQQPYTQQPYNQQQNLLPAQQIVKVNGRDSIKELKLVPNSSLLALDNNEPVVWLCVADGVGNVSATAYDITIHKDKDEIQANNFEERLSKLEKTIAGWGDRYEKSNNSNAKPKQYEK